ncbi:MAG: xanthine dehydrogenase family protein subunit M [Micromonosporaceae bacterium]|nr:xanthine dehydrogenase family protein subunit M [Micromonosporaceae bacterium]
MNPFDFATAANINDAIARAGAGGSMYLAGGTNLVDLMKLGVALPSHVVDIKQLPLRGIWTDAFGLHIGALEKMADVQANPLVKAYPVLAQALNGASPQLRNMATIGGNLLQRTRCNYFRDTAMPCNKRSPGSGCPAINGENRAHAILGGSDFCVATHASDFAVALVALGAQLALADATFSRTLPLVALYRLPGSTPQLENTLLPGELISAVLVPPLPWATRSTYLKLRDRRSYGFALASAAVAADLATDGTIRDVRVAVGGVATVPWRAYTVENALRGQPLQQSVVDTAAQQVVVGARPLAQNRFKVALVQRVISRALLSLGGTNG